jgi:kelch-like protein 2/3
MIKSRNYAGLCVVKDHFVFAIGGVKFYGCNGYTGNSINSVEMLDVSSSSLRWVFKADMLVSRKSFGIGVLDNCIYAVSHVNILLILCYK